jgi:hypothetical protein
MSYKILTTEKLFSIYVEGYRHEVWKLKSDSRKTVMKELVVNERYTLNTDDQTGQGRL